MATTRNAPPADPPEADEGFTDKQRSQLEEMIKAAVGSSTPPAPPDPGGPPPKTDDEWDAMSDRQRESWVRKLVDFRLDELAKEDADARRDAEIEALKAAAKPEPERPPSVVTKLQAWLWGGEAGKS